ncbi:hypothetical protein [uncultured Cetobacterium sp.]|uniref:hypothetical protein n=1 Tax=uncultured Cetobacterium sp. TaxID=527638 RepID=UPI0026224E6C|nr:hypothetical protein [uncultured Cetobacterium sp.]
MSKTLKIQKHILEYLEEKIKYPNLKFYEFFLPKESGMRKENEEKENSPIIVLSPLNEIKDNLFRKRIFRIIIGVNGEDDAKASKELFELGELVVETIEKNSLVPGKFAINPSTIKSEFNIEECGMDYWVYSVTFEANIPTPKSNLLAERGF